VGYYNELFDLKKRCNPSVRWIIHGFRGKPQLAEQALKAGFDLSFGEKLNEQSVRITPLENLFVETDESLLPIEQIYEKIASIRHCNIEDLNAGRKLLNC
jgi:TatD DNase family protein